MIWYDMIWYDIIWYMIWEKNLRSKREKNTKIANLLKLKPNTVIFTIFTLNSMMLRSPMHAFEKVYWVQLKRRLWQGLQGQELF